jgi:anti-sigma regulatory factor (Ser/Thr protein kinase)
MSEARSCETHFGPDLAGVKAGRHFVQETLLRWGLPSLLDDAGLGVSELIANAVRHAGTGFAVRVDVADQVVITVIDGHPDLAAAAPEQPGRGLTIVRAICQDWGVNEVAGGKAVWFSLPLPNENAADADMFDLDAHRADKDERRRSAAGGDDIAHVHAGSRI